MFRAVSAPYGPPAMQGDGPISPLELAPGKGRFPSPVPGKGAMDALL